MKKTRELTTTHYRRSIKRSGSGNIQNADLQIYCPICGAPLTADLVRNSEGITDTKAAHVCSLARKNGAKDSDSRSTRNRSTPQKPESLGEG
jgi:hypothetical protein